MCACACNSYFNWLPWVQLSSTELSTECYQEKANKNKTCRIVSLYIAVTVECQLSELQTSEHIEWPSNLLFSN